MNNQVFYFFYNFAHQSATFDNIVIFFATYFPYVVVFLAGLFLLMHHEVIGAESPWDVFMEKKKEIIMVFIVGAAAWVVAYVLKFLFQIARPFDALPHITSLIPETGYGFPSGHATFFMALAVAIFFYHKKAGYWFMFFALLIGIARVIAGVHSPLDILGGFVLGAVIAYFMKNV